MTAPNRTPLIYRVPTFMRPALTRPDPTEHAAFALTYINASAAALQETGIADVRDLMATQCDQLEALVRDISDEQANAAYAPGKWSLKESIVHMSDSERVFTYRALRVARGDATPLSSFEQDDYVVQSRSNRRTLADILAEFRAVRSASLALMNSLDEEALGKMGIANGNPLTPRAMCWVVAGHAAHHVALTRDRYVPALKAL